MYVLVFNVIQHIYKFTLAIRQGTTHWKFQPLSNQERLSQVLKHGSEETAETMAVIGSFLIIAHPELYHAGRKVFFEIMNHSDAVKDGEAVLEVLKYWTSPFSGYGLISNCCTPLH
ncbi:hypothetical protein L208DRAFT_1467477 [Tricholoma matsutake]|nr:hypothetical protein L208DRAFT_1467477 [Tricholoma matsutake 945]